ncbi:DUF1559 domain-containing protein [Planctomycetota bacterium]
MLELIAVLGLLIMFVLIFVPLHPQGAREEARKAVCKSNLKNIGLCAQMYSQDYRDAWPAFHSGMSFRDARDADELSVLYSTFVTDAALFKCMSSSVDVRADQIDTSLDVPIVSDMSYSYIGNGVINEDSIQEKIVAGDWWNEGEGSGERSRRRRPVDGRLPSSNHDGGMNVLYGDCHVEWLSAVGTRVFRGDDDLHAPSKNAWDAETSDTVLYAGDGTIDDIPETR